MSKPTPLEVFRTRSASYEAFYEALQELPSHATRAALLSAAEDTGLDESEVVSLVPPDKTRDQVVDKVRKRIEYVERNIETLVKWRDKEEAAMEEGADEQDNDGLLMDIHEELDDEGNVMKATINGKDPEELLRTIDTSALGKFEQFMEDDNAEAKEPEGLEQKEQPKAAMSAEKREPRKAEGGDGDESDDEFMKHEGGGLVKVVDDPPEPKPDEWVREVPGETLEEARLRQEMVNYNMQELGAVVAELNLEESGGYYGYEGDSYDEDDGYDSEGSDEYGRSTGRIVTDEIRQEVEEIRRRIEEREGKRELPAVSSSEPLKKGGKKGVRFSEDLDIAPTGHPPKKELLPPESDPPKAALRLPKKGDPDADIAPADDDALPFLAELLARDQIRNAGPVPPPGIPPHAVPRPEPEPIVKREPEENAVAVSALREDIVEHETLDVTPPSAPRPPKRLSRFRAAKIAESKEAVSSNNAVVADQVVEHPPTADEQLRPPNNLEPEFHRKEVRQNYHRLRNKMIQQQGGFVAASDDAKHAEDGIELLDENGGEVKMSRFKKARLKGLV